MFASTTYYLLTLWADDLPPVVIGGLYFLLVFLGIVLICELIGLRYIPNSRVGIVEKLWSAKGSVEEGRIIALSDEAGYHADILRGGFHLRFWRWQYRIHKVALVTVPQGKIGYGYARDGQPLQPSQTLGRVVASNYFQDARAFLGETGTEDPTQLGQRGRQRAILREERAPRQHRQRLSLGAGNVGRAFRGVAAHAHLAMRSAATGGPSRLVGC